MCTYCSLPHAFTSELKPSHYHSGLKFGEIGSTLQLALECNHSPQQKLYFVGGMLTQTLSVFHWGVTAKHQIRTRTQKQNLNSFLTSLFKTAFIYIFFLFFFYSSWHFWDNALFLFPCGKQQGLWFLTFWYQSMHQSQGFEVVFSFDLGKWPECVEGSQSSHFLL